jgi:hypothetical protein
MRVMPAPNNKIYDLFFRHGEFQGNFQGPRFRFHNTAYETHSYYPERLVWNINVTNMRHN